MKDNYFPLINESLSYKPFYYPELQEIYDEHERMHWLVSEIDFSGDISDWRREGALTDEERGFLTQIFRFFTQADCDVASCYRKIYLRHILNNEASMLLLSFGAREGTHIKAYSALIDQIGMPEREYLAFNQYPEMVRKHEYNNNFSDSLYSKMYLGKDLNKEQVEHNINILEQLAFSICRMSMFGEGLQLFSSFVALLNFSRQGLLSGMGQIVSWSIRDETVHVKGMAMIFNIIIKYIQDVGRIKDSFLHRLYKECEEMVKIEFNFIDMIYDANSEHKDLKKEDLKNYVLYVANIRLKQMGLMPKYHVVENPLPWVDQIVFSREITNFFEETSTEYSKGGGGDWDV